MLYIDKDTFRKNLKFLIRNKDVSIMDIATALNVHRTTIYGWINGRSLPSAPMLTKLAEFLNVDIGFLLAPVDYVFDDEGDFIPVDEPNHSVDISNSVNKIGKTSRDSSLIDDLVKLSELYKDGLLTKEEFIALKSTLMDDLKWR